VRALAPLLPPNAEWFRGWLGAVGSICNLLQKVADVRYVKREIDDLLGMKSHIKRKIIAIVCVFLLLVVTPFYVMRIPLRGGYLGPVAVSAPQYKTNALGQVTAMVAITNGGSHTIRFAVGTQMFQNSGWVDSVTGLSNHFNLSIEPDPLVPPHAERVVPVGIPATTSPWRVYAMCQKEYQEHWSKRMRWIADVYVLKRGVVEHFYSPEIQR
jgi:hypothetical protein